MKTTMKHKARHDFRIALMVMIIFSIGLACTRQVVPGYTMLSAKVTDLSQSVQINYAGEWRDASLTTAGTFVDTLDIVSPQYVWVSIGEHSTKLFIGPGDKVDIRVDTTFSFGGDNVEINAHLYQVGLDDYDREGYEFNNHEAVFTKNESDYIKYRDSIRQLKLSQLAKLSANEAFLVLNQKDIEFEYHYDVARYPDYHSYYFNDYVPTALITDFYQGVPMDDETYARNYPDYRRLLDILFNKKIENIRDSSLTPLEGHLEVLEGIESPTILHNRLNLALLYYTVNEKNMTGMRDRMLALAKLDKTKQAIAEHYAVISKLQPGTVAPGFDFINHAGGNTKLEDLKGKYVYIDMWATWCTPCIVEIPYLHEIESEFQNSNIEFVSISVDEPWSQGTWREMVVEKEMQGIQLLANNGMRSEFVQRFGIQGIPHFILLDDKGLIVSANAERPSDPKLLQRLRALPLW